MGVTVATRKARLFGKKKFFCKTTWCTWRKWTRFEEHKLFFKAQPAATFILSYPSHSSLPRTGSQLGYCHTCVPGLWVLELWPCRSSEQPGGCSRRGEAMETGDGQCWNDNGLPWPRSPQQSHVLWLSHAVTFRTFSRAPGGQQCTVGSFLCASFKAEAERASPSSWRPGKPSPDAVLALRGCPSSARRNLHQVKSSRALQAALQVPVTHVKWGIFLYSCRGIPHRRKARWAVLAWAVPQPWWGKEQNFLENKPPSFTAVEELLPLQQCTHLVFQERREVEDVFEDGCGWQTAQGR